MNIWKILAKFGAVAGTIGTLYVAFTLLDDIRDDVGDVKKDVVVVKAQTDSLMVLDRLNKIQNEENKKAISQNADQLELIMDSYLKHIRNDDGLTKEEFIEYMDPFLEYVKKNSSQIRIPQLILDSVRFDVTGSIQQDMRSYFNP